MSAPEKIAILAGGGRVPSCVAHAFTGDVFVVGFAGQSDPSFVESYDHIWVRMGQTATIIKALKARGISDLVLVGGMQRPSWREVRPDFKTMEFLAKHAMTALGDNGLLVALRGFLEKEGFRLHGAHVFAPDLLMPAGVMGRVEPSPEQLVDIALGFEASQELGAADIGQAVLVKDGAVIGRESETGTDALMADYGTAGAVLVKSCKPQQDLDLDLPTAGLVTIKNARAAGLAGVALHTGRSMLLDRAEIIAYADAHNMFVVGIDE